jgi:arginase family enzyme
MVPREVELTGVPTNSSGTVDGVARAPAVLREHGLSAALASKPGFTDAGDLALPAPQSGGLTWEQLTEITSAALASPGCAGWSVCIYNPDLDPGRRGADDIISYITKATASADGK